MIADDDSGSDIWSEGEREQIIAKINQFGKEEYDKLKSSSKELFELLSYKEFKVEGVLSENYSTRVQTADIMNIPIGSRIPTSEGGYRVKTILDVGTNNSGIEKLVFEGISFVRRGDSVKARIPLYKIKKFHGFVDEDLIEEDFYLPREKFNPQEKAIELEIMGKDGLIDRTERSVDYELFVRK